MQSGSLHLEHAPVSLDAAVGAAIDGIRPTADAKRLTIRYECERANVVVNGDASRLQQIASNLLVNAVKFTPENRAVNVSLAVIDDVAELTIADEGIGIDPDFVPYLFERFRQADTGNARRHGGLGLGLSIVSNLVQLHGGEVRAHSDGANKGAVFTVRLALAKTQRTPVQSAGGVNVDAADPFRTLHGLRVLVVDDEADVRGAVAGLLERAGATVMALESGSAIESALIEFAPQVLVLDISMPGEDGYSLIRRIRRLSREDGGRVPAISLTAHARAEDRQRAIQSGFQAHLPKPLNLAALVSTIHSVVEPQTHWTESPNGSEPTAPPISAA
jgi:CheY-like chemotaxis protein